VGLGGQTAGPAKIVILNSEIKIFYSGKESSKHEQSRTIRDGIGSRRRGIQHRGLQ
jgi:hypothetical protein